MPKPLAFVVAAALALAAWPSVAAPIGPLDTFEDGTTQGWTVGLGPNGVPVLLPQNVADGGPAGAGDAFLRLTSSGQLGPSGRLTAMNVTQWAGNYLEEGIAGLRMDVRNPGGSDLSLRLLFETLAIVPTNIAMTDAIFLPAGSDWTTIVFPISVPSLTAVLGSVEGALAQTHVLRIFHSPEAAFPPPMVLAMLDVDNITVLPQQVPEPAFVLMLGAGLVAERLRRRRY